MLFKSRWDSGMLEFREGSLRWVDSKQTGKNLLVPMAQITEQQLTCLKKAGGNECFEWVVKTRNEEYSLPRRNLEAGRERESAGSVRLLPRLLPEPGFVTQSCRREVRFDRRST